MNLLTNDFNQNYCCGYLISITSVGFITLTIDFNNKNVLVSDYLPNLKEEIWAWISTFDFSKTEGLQEIRDNIDQYLGENQK